MSRMFNSLEGRSVLVTGGTKGIGRATCELFAQEGANVAFCARNADEVAEAQASMSAHGTQVVGSVLDVADADARAGPDRKNCIAATRNRPARNARSTSWLPPIQARIED